MIIESPSNSMPLVSLMDCLSGWRIFLCTGTNHIGLAPGIAAKGDILISVEGAQNPCLMRPVQNGCWRLISGDCFAMCYDSHALNGWHIEPRDMSWHNEVIDETGDIVWQGGLGETEEFVIV